MYAKCFALVKCTVVNIVLSYIVGASWFFVISMLMAAVRADRDSNSHRDVVLTKKVVASAMSSTVSGMAIKFALFAFASSVW
jgi:hypothetical protein